MPIKNVIIAGAGPSGLLLALLLARHPSPDPIQITLFDAAEGLDPRPRRSRAAYYGPAAIDTLSRAGVLADMRARGFDPRWMTWKKLWSAARHAAAPGEGAELLAKIDLDSGWDRQVYYDFTKWGYHDVQFFIHPEHFHMVARLCGPPREYWRVSYGERSGLTHEQLLKRVPEKFAAMLPGHPQPGDYEVVGFSPYRVHQRLAPSMRVGRVLLAADAAHLCNPFGGLGLTGGIVDVGGLYDCLAGIHDGLAYESILDVYSDVRRKMWTDVIDPISSENIRRLFAQDPEKAAETDEFLKLVNRVEKDEELRKQFRASLHAIEYDFKQHYRNAEAANGQDGAAKEAEKSEDVAISGAVAA
ncbi:Pyoverdine biosynthesis [Macrophomina phaseolina MS6]|uniref:Pyoverdine biosynthesis n=1 Tax=Macrophomina phaseolina (strain MS6) TaxID=1126212 RepID=K2S181_MACPH|nr:Pyoverdine biosynthesis [Macrophomina phaseolina MS6]